MLPGSAVLHVGVGVLPHHVIDGAHDVSHLLDTTKGRKGSRDNNDQHNTQLSRKHRKLKHLSGYAAILVQVVQIEGPVELVGYGASQNDGQTYDEVLQQDKEKMTEIKKVTATSEGGNHLVEMKARGTGKYVCCPQ